MFNIKKITNRISERICSETGLNNDQKEVVAYGAFAILQILICIALVVIFGIIFNVLIEALIVSFSISILRKYSGGVHASSPGICAVFSTIIAVGQAVIISFLLTPLINFKLVIIFGSLIFVWAYYIVYKLAPVDSLAKPIKTQQKKKRMKKASFLILGIYIVIIIINIIMYLLTHEKSFFTFSLCIYGGTAWQAFTLTNAGNIIFLKIDAFFHKILVLIRGGR